jgi:hypothetical protein
MAIATECANIVSREDCFFCVRKHLSQAQILLDESQLGYPTHKWLAIGHMAEAESESIRYSPELATMIRATRVCIMGQTTDPDKIKECKSVYDLLCEACRIADTL